jgi:hypothetical protein
MPQDTLVAILAHIPIFRIGMLYLCGDSYFNHRLRKGRIVLRLGLNNNSRIAWPMIPKLVSIFDDLQEMSIEFTKRYPGALNLSILGPSLRSLNLSADLWASSLYTDDTFHTLLSAKDLWPQLHTFVAVSRYEPHYPPKWLLQLPSTITKLSVPLILYEDIPALPDSLEDLSCSFNMEQWPIEGHKLPISLTKLDATFMQPVAFLSYPPNLTSSETRWYSEFPDWSEFDERIRETEGLILLPRNLERLVTTISQPLSMSIVITLPPTLTSLSITEKKLDQGTFYEWLAHLPRNITSLNGTIMGGINNLKPKFATDAGLEAGRSQVIKYLQMLPRALKSLPQAFSPELIDHIDVTKALPPNLTKLIMRSVPKECIDVILTLPLSELTVSVTKGPEPMNISFQDSLRKLVLSYSSQATIIWPKFLTTIRLNLAVTVYQLQHLSPTITELSGVLEQFENLPALSNLTRLRSLLFHLRRPPSDGKYDLFVRSISPTLQVFAIIQDRPFQGPSDLLQSMSHISMLRAFHVMRVISEFTEDDIACLPRNLALLRIKSGVNKITDPERLVAALPPYIGQISLPEPKFEIPIESIKKLVVLQSFIIDNDEHEYFARRNMEFAAKRERDVATLNSLQI